MGASLAPEHVAVTVKQIREMGMQVCFCCRLPSVNLDGGAGHVCAFF